MEHQRGVGRPAELLPQHRADLLRQDLQLDRQGPALDRSTRGQAQGRGHRVRRPAVVGRDDVGRPRDREVQQGRRRAGRVPGRVLAVRPDGLLGAGRGDEGQGRRLPRHLRWTSTATTRSARRCSGRASSTRSPSSTPTSTTPTSCSRTPSCSKAASCWSRSLATEHQPVPPRCRSTSTTPRRTV